MATELEPIQSNFTFGELDPQLLAREGADTYYAGAERVRNALLIPHGGFTRRPGLLYRDTLVPVLDEIDLSGATITAPEGGTAANATDGDPSTKVTTTTNIGTVDPYVILHVDLGASFGDAIRFVDVRNISTTDAFISIANEVRVQFSDDNIAWTDLESAFPFVTDEDDRWNFRRAFVTPAVHRYLRVVRIGNTDGGTRKFELGEFRLFKDLVPATLGASRLIQFESGGASTFSLLATDRNIRVFQNGIRQADISIPHTPAQLQEINWTQSLDTLLIFHNEVQPHLVRRLGQDDLWRDQSQSFSNIPDFDFNDQGVGAEPVWGNAPFGSGTIIRGWPRAGSFFKGRLYMGGTADLSQTYWASGAKGDLFDFAEGLGAADDAFIVTMDTDEAADIYAFEPTDFLFIISSSGPFYQGPRDDPPTPDNVTVQRVRGKKRARGPGFRTFQLDTGVVFLDDSGEQVNEITETVFRGRFEVNNLAFLAPHLIRDPQDITLRRSLSTDRGDLLLLVNSDGSLAVLHTLRARDFTGWAGWHAGKGSGDAFQGKFLSVGTQVGGINGRYFAVVRRSINGRLQDTLEEFLDNCFSDSALQLNATFESFTAVLGQSEFTYTFDSPAAASDIKVRRNQVLLEQGVDYTVDLGTKLVALAEPSAAGDIVRIAINISTVTGLDHLEGETCRVRVNNAVGSNVTVSNGSVTISELADEAVEVGLDFPDVKEILVDELMTRSIDPLTEEEARFEVFAVSNGSSSGVGVLVRDMPIAVPPGGNIPTLRGRLKRVHTATVVISNTQGFGFGANDEPSEEVPLAELGDFLLDRRPPYRSGTRRIYNLQGWTLDGQTEITQSDPVPMTILSVSRRVAVAL